MKNRITNESNTPQTFAEAKELARSILEEAIVRAEKKLGEKPEIVDGGNCLYCKWADGEISNRVEISEEVNA